MVLLESDVAAAFPTGRAVNKALRGILLAQKKAALANKALQPTNRARREGSSARRPRTARGANAEALGRQYTRGGDHGDHSAPR